MKLTKNALGSPLNPIQISVIVPTFNAKSRLLLLINSLKNQTCKNFELIVVDDGSTDGTREAVMGLKNVISFSLHYYYLDNTDIFGAGIARNFGANYAKGEVLLFLDQDCVAESHLIENHLKHHKDKSTVLGYYAGYGNSNKNYDFLKLEEYVKNNQKIPAIEEFRHELFENKRNKDAWKCFVSAHFSIKKQIFDFINFDESFTQWGCEDIDLGYRLHKEGIKIYFENNCVVYNSCGRQMNSKDKLLSLSTSLIQMFNKHKTTEIKLYCLERFYHYPLEYRNRAHMIFNNKGPEMLELKSFISIDKNFIASVNLKEDYMMAFKIIENIIPNVKSIKFNVGFIKYMDNNSVSIFRDSFHQLIGTLRNNRIIVNFKEIRKESFLLGKRLLGPEELSIDFHNKCNAKCLFCILNSPIIKEKAHVPVSLDLNAIQNILTQAYEMGVEKIRIPSEGEPLLSPDSVPLLEMIAKMNFELDLVTNGTRLDREHIKSLYKITRIGILVNLSAVNKKTYHDIYGGNIQNYDLVINALKSLVELKNRKIKRGDAVNISTTFIITTLNYNEIAEYILFIKALGVEHIYFRLAIIYEGSEKLCVSNLEPKILKTELMKALACAHKYGISTNLNEIYQNVIRSNFNNTDNAVNPGFKLPTDQCYNGWFFARINSSGKYYICCRETVDLGNTGKMSFKDIFFSEQMKKLLNEGASGISLDKKMWSKCSYCYHLKTNKTAKNWLENNETAHSCH